MIDLGSPPLPSPPRPSERSPPRQMYTHNPFILGNVGQRFYTDAEARMHHSEAQNQQLPPIGV